MPVKTKSTTENFLALFHLILKEEDIDPEEWFRIFVKTFRRHDNPNAPTGVAYVVEDNVVDPILKSIDASGKVREVQKSKLFPDMSEAAKL